MADKFLNTGQGAVNLSNGTVNIIAAELGAINLIPSKPVKTNATKQLVSENLDISDVTNLENDLKIKSELDFVESDTARTTPPTGQLKLYAKTDKRFYKLNDQGDEKQIGNVYSTGSSTNKHLVVWQGGSGDHIENSGIYYNQATSGLVNVETITNGTNEIIMDGGIELFTPATIYLKGAINCDQNSLTGVGVLNNTILNGMILQSDGGVPMDMTYTPSLAQDIATKYYVDTHSTSGNYVKVDGTSTMTGDLQMGLQDITNANEVGLKVINKVGTQENITCNTTYFDINGGDYGAVLRLIADDNNVGEQYNCQIQFYQDGYTHTGGIFTGSSNGNNKINISSAGTSGTGIDLRVGAATDPMETAPVKLAIDNTHTTVEDYFVVKGTSGPGERNYISRQMFVQHPNSSVAGWWQGCQNTNPNTSDNDYYFEVVFTDGDTHTPAYIQDTITASTPAQMNFTGQHRCYTMAAYTEDMLGKLFCSTGRYMNYLKIDEECTTQKCVTINDAHPVVEICDEIKSKRVFGVCSGLEPMKRVFDGGSFQSLYNKESSDNRLMINGLGEGSILVINNGEIYENGDLLESYHCYASKQADDIHRSTTVAKITCDIDFNNIPMEDVRIYKGSDEKTNMPIFENVLNEDGTIKQQPKFKVQTVTLNGESKQVALVGCIFLMS
jgi:hypothetical protein